MTAFDRAKRVYWYHPFFLFLEPRGCSLRGFLRLGRRRHERQDVLGQQEGGCGTSQSRGISNHADEIVGTPYDAFLEEDGARLELDLSDAYSGIVVVRYGRNMLFVER